MATDRLQLESLRSFTELTDSDQKRCSDSFHQEQLQEKNLLNKYLKRTEQLKGIACIDSKENDSFLCFDIYPLNIKYSTILFCLCGISTHCYHVLYLNVIEDTKMNNNVAQFVCDLLANILNMDMPKLTSFNLKFILCRDNTVSKGIIQMFAKSKKTSSLYNIYPIIQEMDVAEKSLLHYPYVQNARLQIMQGNFTQANVAQIFGKHREAAKASKNEYLIGFIDAFHKLARDLLESKFQINLRLCTMERLDNFEQIIRIHMTNYKEQTVKRSFLFDVLRALIHIYGL